MRTIRLTERSQTPILHVEADGCIVNVQVGLRDREGRRVTRIDVIPDGYIGEEWDADGPTAVRVIERKEGQA